MINVYGKIITYDKMDLYLTRHSEKERLARLILLKGLNLIKGLEFEKENFVAGFLVKHSDYSIRLQAHFLNDKGVMFIVDLEKGAIITVILPNTKQIERYYNPLNIQPSSEIKAIIDKNDELWKIYDFDKFSEEVLKKIENKEKLKLDDFKWVNKNPQPTEDPAIEPKEEPDVEPKEEPDVEPTKQSKEVKV